MKKKTMAVIFSLIFLSLFFVSGCGSPEENAKSLYNQAQAEMRKGNEKQAIALLEEIVEKYPQTDFATLANAMLNIQIFSSAVGQDIQRMKKQRHELDKKAVETALHMFRLDHGRYPTEEEGLRALFFKPHTMSRWKGPYLEGGEQALADLHIIYKCKDERHFELLP